MTAADRKDSAVPLYGVSIVQDSNVPANRPSIASLSDALQLHKQGRLQEAEQIYRQILATQPDHADAWHLLGVARHQQDDHTAALEHIGLAIRLNSGKANYFNNYGAALQSLGRHSDAIEYFRRALAIRPGYADALANLGTAEFKLGQHEAALSSFRNALTAQPFHVDATKRLARLLQYLGRSDEAIRLLEQALTNRPTAQLWFDYGDVLTAVGRTEEAADAYRQSLAIEPNQPAAHFNLGGVLEERHEIQEAIRHFDRAVELQPQKPLWSLRAAACIPAVFPNNEAIDAYRTGLSTMLAQWQARLPPSLDWDEIAAAGVFPKLAISYHGRDSRGLKEQFASLFLPHFREQPEPQGSGLIDRRRIGFLVTRRHEGLFLRCMRGVLERLDSERFEVVCLCSAEIAGTIRQAIQRDDIRIVSFGEPFSDAVRTLRAVACDVIYYWEVGSDRTNYFLPFARLAPVQCTGWASTITTGVAAVDYFYSSELIDPPGSEKQYTETLWRSSTLFSCEPRTTASTAGDAGRFGLPDDCRLYYCPQNPLKLHPDIDPLFAEILSRDSKARIAIANRRGRAGDLLQERFAHRIPQGSDRIVFLPWLGADDYCRILNRADVILDPPHYSAGSSCYDIFSGNRPVVTLLGETIVGRVTAGFYRKMGFTELVAESASEYVEKAIQVANDREYREYAVNRIRQASDALFNDVEAVREYERFFETILCRAT